MRLNYLVETESQSQFDNKLIELLREGRASEALDGNAGRSDSDVLERETQDDEGLEDRRREFQGNEEHDGGIERDNYQRSSRSLEKEENKEENIEITEEAEQASFSMAKMNQAC